jgi:RNA polymerase sigma factor (sigma-70 family)
LAEDRHLAELGLQILETVAARVARGLRSSVIDADDLMSVGRMALSKHLAEYDSERGAVGPYLQQRLSWTLLDYARSETHGRSSAARTMALIAAERRLEAAPSANGVDNEDEALAVLRTRMSAQVAGLAAGLLLGEHSPLAPQPEPTPEDHAIEESSRRAVRSAIATLPEREQEIIHRYYFQNETFPAIARDLGLSKSWMSRLHAQAIDTLAEVLRPKQLLDGQDDDG